MPYGFEDTDTGYIFGSSWNVYNGQIPHRDFIYTRPAIPAFLHTIFLFISETYGYLLDRSFFYIQIFLYSLLGTKLLFEHFEIRSKTSLYFIASLAAITTIHNYPPMGWNTIDGVLFCVLAFYFILKKNTSVLYILLGSFCLMLGVFSKQSFYFIPIFLFAYLVLQKDWFRLKYFVIFGFLSLISYLGFKLANGSLAPFWEQTFQRTSSSALVEAGIKTYYLAVKFHFLHVLGVSALAILAVKFRKNTLGYLITNLIIISYIAVSFWNNSGDWSVIKIVMQFLFMAATAYAFWMVLKDRRYLLLLLLLTLSWSASISNGFRTPIHFALPMVFTLYFFFYHNKNQSLSIPVAAILLVGYLITFGIGYQYIYRDSPRKELTHNMGEVFPQLATIKSDKSTYEKYTELKQLSTKYPKFTAIPSMPLANYLTRTVNPIGTDWPLDVEINDEALLLVQQLSEKNTTVLLEKLTLTPYEADGYDIIPLIKNTWTLIEEGRYFDVYQSK